MNLKNYLKILADEGFLKEEEIGLDQIKALLKSASKNLSAARINLGIDEETCYTMAYNRQAREQIKTYFYLIPERPDFTSEASIILCLK